MTNLIVLYMLYFVVILSWFVETHVATEAVNGTQIIQEEDIEMRPEKVSTSCIDENVCVDICRKYCTQDAWSAIKSVVSILHEHPTWYCQRCTLEIDDDVQSSIVCESCLVWYHFQCIGIKNAKHGCIACAMQIALTLYSYASFFNI